MSNPNGRLRLPYIPDYSASLKKAPRIRMVQFGEGYSQRSQDGLNPVLQKWSVKFGGRTKADKEQIDAFFEAHGGVTPFEVELPDSSWSVTAEQFGTGDGTSTQFQLRRLLSTATGISSLPNAYRNVFNFDATPVVYVDGVAKVEGTDYTRDYYGMLTFSVAPANGAVLTFTASGTDVKLFTCDDWTDVLSNYNAYDVDATLQEVAER